MHPKHVVNAIPYSQAIRAARLCSSESDLNNQLKLLKHRLINREFPATIIDNAF
jgi:hypothetical protein